jgi:hypothetical protein
MITKGAISGAGTVYLSRAPEFTPGFQWCSCYSIISFMYMCCRSFCFVFFLLAIVLSVLLRFTDSDYPFGIFKFFLSIAKMQIVLFHVCLGGMRYQNQYNAKSIIKIWCCCLHQCKQADHVSKEVLHVKTTIKHRATATDETA